MQILEMPCPARQAGHLPKEKNFFETRVTECQAAERWLGIDVRRGRVADHFHPTKEKPRIYEVFC